MSLVKVIPKIFYADIKVGLHLFVEGLGFKISYQDDYLKIVERDGVTLQLVQDEECAKKDRPEIRIVTDDIEALYNEVKDKNPGLLHPNLNVIKRQPWSLTEFALRDSSDVCVIIQQND